MSSVNNPVVAGGGGGTLYGSVGLTGVTYDGSNRVTAFTINNINYTVAYASGSMTISGSDGTTRTVALDGSGRVSGVT
jgi:hypothetical protein